jgi:hypothetical protein
MERGIRSTDNTPCCRADSTVIVPTEHRIDNRTIGLALSKEALPVETQKLGVYNCGLCLVEDVKRTFTAIILLPANDGVILAAVKITISKSCTRVIANDAAVFDAVIKVAMCEIALSASGNVDSGFAIAIDWGERTVLAEKDTPNHEDLAWKGETFRSDGDVADCEAINRCGYAISKGTRDGDEPEQYSAANRWETIENDNDIRQTIRDFSSQPLKKQGQ